MEKGNYMLLLVNKLTFSSENPALELFGHSPKSEQFASSRAMESL